MGWIGIGAGAFSILGAFALAAEEFAFVGLVGVILEISWFLGIGIGLWRGLPERRAQSETGSSRELRPPE